MYGVLGTEYYVTHKQIHYWLFLVVAPVSILRTPYLVVHDSMYGVLRNRYLVVAGSQPQVRSIYFQLAGFDLEA